MSDEFPADDFGVYAPGLRVTKLGPDGEQLFSVEQGKITFHKSGVYEIQVPATVRMLEDAEPSDYEYDGEPSPEIQRAAHLGIARSWVLDGTLSLDELIGSLKGEGEDKAPLGRPTAPHVVTSDGQRRTDEQDWMVASDVTTMVARQDGLLPEVYVTHEAGENLPVRVLREAGPNGQIAASVMLFRNRGVPSVGTLQGINQALQANSEKLVRELGKAQGDLRAEREISAELRTRLDTALGNFAEVNTTANDRQRTIETLRRWALLARQTLHYQARWIEEAYEIREGDAADREQLDRTLRNAIKIMREVDAKHPDSPNVGQVAPPDTTQLSSEGVDDTTQRDVPPNEFFKVVDGDDKTPAVWVTHSGDADVPVTVERTVRDHGTTVLLRLHNMSRTPHERNEDAPWSLREWALLARQTMEQQAEQCDVLDALLSSMPGMTIERRPRRIAVHAVKTLREVVAEYPEDLDAVQAEQATRNADDEAVRRLAHAMAEVANQLDTVYSPFGPDDHIRALQLKLRDTVNTWTTEEQRRPWAQATSGNYSVGSSTHELHGNQMRVTGLQADQGAPPAVWWVAHAGCNHNVELHDDKGCNGDDAACTCGATAESLIRQASVTKGMAGEVHPEEAAMAAVPRGGEGASWAPGVVFREVLEALHQAEWLTRHLRGSLPSDFIGPNNELNRLVRGLLGLDS